MQEGWYNDNYVIVFDNSELDQVTKAYGTAEFIPEFKVVGVRGWDELVLMDGAGMFFRIPAVPLNPKYLKRLGEDWPPTGLVSDDTFSGKIKWYVKPIVFGGDASSEENITWVDLHTHQNLVKWWNQKYCDIAGNT